MVESRTRNVINNTVASVIFKIVYILSQFVLRTVFIYTLGNEYVGISGLFTDILSVLSLMEMGLDVSMVYALYKPLAEDDHVRISALLKFYKKVFNWCGVIVIIIGVSCVPFLRYIMKGEPNIVEDIRLIFMMYVFTSAFSYFLIYKSILLRANQRSRLISKWSSIIQILECIIEVVLILLFKMFFIYLIVRFIMSVVRNVILSYISTKEYSQYFQNNSGSLEKEEVKYLVKNIMCLTAYNLSGVAINSTSSIFISVFVGTIEIAIIGNFTLIVNSVRAAIEQIVNVSKPSIGNLAATSSIRQQELVFERMNFISFYIACFCTVCFYTLLNLFVGDIWLDPKYEISNNVIAILSINFYIAIMVFPVESFRTANGLFIQGWFRPIVMAIMNIVLGFLLGKEWGVLGIFLAITISRLSTQVWFDSYLVYKIVFNKKPWKYYRDYVFRFFFTIFLCLFVKYVFDCIELKNVYLNFFIGFLVSFVIINIFFFLLFYKNENMKYMISVMCRKSIC